MNHGPLRLELVVENLAQSVSEHGVNLTVNDNGLCVFTSSAAIALDTSMFLSLP
jgi:hypothetical protein